MQLTYLQNNERNFDALSGRNKYFILICFFLLAIPGAHRIETPSAFGQSRFSASFGKGLGDLPEEKIVSAKDATKAVIKSFKSIISKSVLSDLPRSAVPHDLNFYHANNSIRSSYRTVKNPAEIHVPAAGAGMLQNGTVPGSNSATDPPPDLYNVRIKLNNPAYANYVHAENPYNKSLVSIFQIDDSPKHIYSLMYPYLKGGTTAGGYVSPGVKSTDGAGNDLFWTISAACFVQSSTGVDFLEEGTTYISWGELATMSANGAGLQRGFDYINHAFGGSDVLSADRYKQIYLNNKAAYDHLGYQPESLVIPDVQIGYRFGANDMGMDVTSQGGLDPLKDGAIPLDDTAYADEIYAAVQSPYFFRRMHWQEIDDPSLATSMKADFLAAYNKSQNKPCIFNWFSHGPGEIGTSNFTYYREVIDYMQALAGDNIIGLTFDQYLGYQKTRYAAEHGAGLDSHLTTDGYLDITFDMGALQNTVRNRLITILVNSDAQIQTVEWSPNIKAVTFNPSTGLVNIQLNEITSVDPATLPVRPTIVPTATIIPADTPNTVVFDVDRPITQSSANAYEISGNTVLSVSEVQNSAGLQWKIVCQNTFLSTDEVTLTYKAEIGDATDIGNGKKMLSYVSLPIINQSQETGLEEQPLAISIRRDSDDRQLATFNTIPEVVTYMGSLNINTNISIVFNNAATYVLGTRWDLNYSNNSYTLTIKGKDGLASYPVIDCDGLISDAFRVNMNHVRIKHLKIRSGKYTGDGWNFGDNYTGALISQQAGTSDCQYTYLILHQGLAGITLGAANGTDEPNISNVLIDHVVCTELIGTAISIGRISSIAGEPEDRTNASYTINNVTISNITIRDTQNQADIESSGSKYNGQVVCRGVNQLTLQDIDSDQNQRPPFIIAYCKNVLIDRCRATNFSLYSGFGIRAAFQIESSEIITIQNCFAQYIYESLYIIGSTHIKLYHNTFDTEQSDNTVIELLNVRLVLDIQGNLIVAKGDVSAPAMYVSFYRGAGYIPSIATDFASEKNNLFITSSYIFEFAGLDAGNTSLNVTVTGGTAYSSYKTIFSRGENSDLAAYSALIYTDFNGIHGYLGNASAGRAFVSAQVASVSVDLAKRTRGFPTDIGAYDRGAIISADVSSLSVSGGTLSPAFSLATTGYAASVSNSTASVTITSSPVDIFATAEVSVNGGSYITLSGNTSQPLALNVGLNQIDLKVTSSDASMTKVYNLTVTRASSSFSINEIPDVLINENNPYASITPVITGFPHGGLKYTLSGPDAFDFVIDHATGIVNMVSRNFESPADANADNIYELTINATDASNTTDSEDWKVTVTDVIESAAFSLSPISDATINENSIYSSDSPVIVGNPVGGAGPANFTIIPIPDTQYYTGEKNGGTNAIFKTQANWIVANKDALNVKYIVHLGDCVEDGDNSGNLIQWMRADTAMSILEDPGTTQLPYGIPYGTNVGNHDQSPTGDASGTTIFYNQYFGAARFSGRDYYGGHYGSNNNNNYQLFSAGGMDFIAVNLEFDQTANAQVLDWADDLLKTYPQRRAILSSHYIINPDGSFGPQGQAIYNKLKTNPNLFLMLCGHRNPNGEASRTDTYDGNTVTTLLSDYQDRANGGEGWMRYLEFIPSENRVQVYTYSPAIKEYELDADSRFSFDYNMTSGPDAGSVVYSLNGTDASSFTVNSGSGVVSMSAKNFEAPADADSDNIYELTLVATDQDGNTASKSWKVTVLNIKETAAFAIDPVQNSTVDEGVDYTSVTPVITGAHIGSLTYTLGGADASRFTVDSLTGIVSMVARQSENPADTNADNVYELTLIATDQDENTAAKSWKITVVKKEEPVVFTIGSIQNVAIDEETIYNSVVPVVTGTPAGSLTYTLGGADASGFTVDSLTGVVSMIARQSENPADANSDNIYEIAIIATDDNGNSYTETWTVTVIPVSPDAAQSTFAANDVIAVADGISRTKLTVQARKINGDNITKGGQTVLITKSSGSGTISAVTDNHDGTYTAEVTSPAKTDGAVFVATINGQEVRSGASTRTEVAIEYVPGALSLNNSTITADPKAINPDGPGSSAISIQLRDANDNNLRIGGHSITISTTLGQVGVVTDHNNGTYTATFTKGPVSGNAVVGFAVNGVAAANNVTVSIGNQAPVAASDAACTTEGVAISFNIAENDNDTDGHIDLTSIDLDPSPGTQKSLITGQGVYTVNDAGLMTFAPVPGYKGIATPVNYTVKDNDGAISDFAAVTVTVNPKPVLNVSITEGLQASCVGSRITFTATVSNPGTSVTYQWKIGSANVGLNSPVFSSTSLTDKAVVTCTIISTFSCGLPVTNTSSPITLTINPMPVAAITTSGPLTFFAGGSVNLTATSRTGYSYEWARNGVAIPGATGSGYTATESGSYTVTTSYTGSSCSAVSSPVLINTVYALPANNFKILLTGESCKNSKNGSIRITSQLPENYTVTINGAGISGSYKFTDIVEIKYLSAATYRVCIAVAGHPDFQQCYDLVITAPKDLSLYSAISASAHTISLKMDGAASYHVELNGQHYSTSESQITLSLLNGINELKVSTDNECQGIIEKHINIAMLYPNPFEDVLNLKMNDNNTGKITVTILSLDGRKVHVGQYAVTDNIISLNLSHLKKGFYLLKLVEEHSESTYKIQKN